MSCARSESELRALTERLAASEGGLKEATRRLRAADERRGSAVTAHRALVDINLQALLILQGGRPIFTNQVPCHLPGYFEAELRAVSRSELLSLIHPDGRNGAAATASGAGLGLPVCRGIAEAHVEEISVDSQSCVGTTVSLALPTFQSRAWEIL